MSKWLAPNIIVHKNHTVLAKNADFRASLENDSESVGSDRPEPKHLHCNSKGESEVEQESEEKEKQFKNFWPITTFWNNEKTQVMVNILMALWQLWQWIPFKQEEWCRVITPMKRAN